MSDVEIVVEEAAQVVETTEILQGEELDRLVSYLKDEYGKASNEMEARNSKLIVWRKNMEALASDAPKVSPMKGSSNVTIPLTQTLTQSMYAKMKGTFDARNPFWTVSGSRKDSESVQMFSVVQKYMNILADSPYDLNMEEVKKDLFLETCLCGACFPKVVWSTQKWRVLQEGGSETQVVYHDGPQIVVIPVERTFYRRGIGDIQRLPWIGITTPLTENELREMAAEGIFDATAVEEVLGQERTNPNMTEGQLQKSEWFDESEQTGLFDITEFWVFWDIDGSGVPVDLFFTIHVPTGKVLKQQYNRLGARFIVNAKYIHRPYTLTGRGIGQMTESMNAEATAIHNLTNDNMKIANMRMFVMKRGGYGEKDEIYPGKIFRLDNADDLRSVPIGEIYPSSSQRESLSWNIGQKAVGLSDNQMGFADATMGSRDTARGTAMRLQQGDSILGTVVEGLKTTFSKLGMLVWLQCVANKDRVIAREKAAMRLSDEELGILDKALSIPLGEIPMRISFGIKTTEAEKTFEQQRQNIMALSQLFAQYGQQTIPLAMQLFGPQGLQMKQQAPDMWNYMAKVLTGSGKLIEQIFEFFGTQNTQDYIPDLSLLEKMMQTIGSVGQSFAGTPQMPLGSPQQGPNEQVAEQSGNQEQIQQPPAMSAVEGVQGGV
jgi:hypothetical protein